MGQWLQHHRLLLTGCILAAGTIAVAAFALYPKPTKITTTEISAHGTAGKVYAGANTSTQPQRLATTTALKYESAEVTSPKPKANAAVLKWDQTSAPGAVATTFRVFNGKQWSGWLNSPDDDDRKDGTPATHNALVLSDQIHKIQYRFELTAQNGASPEVNLKTINLQLIDASQGPSPTKPSLISQALSRLGLVQTATAHADGPHIYTRGDWGAPEADSSHEWEPEYRKLNRAIVHHTVTAFTPDSSAAIRAIWQYHTFTQGWGDIGYNYIVDSAGNIFQGRYYDKNVADATRTDVVGGHAYGWNYGTTGIAVLGDFSQARPNERTLRAVGDIIAFKLHRYDVDPTGFFGDWPVVLGHRDVGSTSCPGGVRFDLPSIRTFASNQIWSYRLVDHYDEWITSQGLNGHPGSTLTLVAGDTATAYLDYRNAGIDTWGTTGMNPTRIGSDQPRDRTDPFADVSWLNANRPASFNSKVTSYNGDGTANLTPATLIRPGETGRFEFTLKAPETPGDYVEHYQLVADNKSWYIRDFNVSFRLIVAPRRFAWHGTLQTIYTDATKTQEASLQNLHAGDRLYAVVKVQNDGNQTWKNSGPNPVRLGASHPNDRLSQFCNPTDWTINCGRPATLQEATVAHGGAGTFEFWLTVPHVTQSQQLKEYFNLVAEGQTWMEDPGMYWQFGVIPGP